MHLPRIGLRIEYGGQFGSYINCIGLLQETVFCRCLKYFFNQIGTIFEIAAIVTLKRKIRDGNIRGIFEYI